MAKNKAKQVTPITPETSKEPEQEKPAKKKGVVIDGADNPSWPVVGMTVEEAAKSLRVSTRTVQDMLAAGKLPGRLVGNKWRLSPSGIDEFLSTYEHDEREDDIPS